MAPEPIVLQPGLCQVRPQYTVDVDSGDHVENVLWFLSATTTTPTLTDLAGMAAAFDPAWAAMWNILGAGNKAYTGSVWTDYSSVFGLSSSSVGIFTPVSGVNGGGALPSNV